MAPDVARIMLVDDHPIVGHTLGLMSSERELTQHLMGAAALEALERGTSPDLILLDLDLPDYDGHELARRIRALHPGQRVAIISGTRDGSDISKALAAGCCGFLPKIGGLQVMEAIINLLLAGGRYFPDPEEIGATIARSGWRRGAGNIGSKAIDCGRSDEADGNHRPVDDLDILTRRERDVAGLVAEGYTNKEIARELGIFEGTVKAHLKNLMAKLGARNRTQLAVLAKKSSPV